MKQQRVVGFWMRLLGRLIDMTYVGGLIVLFGWIFTDSIEISPGNTTLGFVDAYKFYLWTLMTMALFAISFIVVPWLTKGRTLGMFICRIKINFEDDKKRFIPIVKREMFFSIAWIWSTFLLMTIINHTLINKFAQTNQPSDNNDTGWVYTTWDLVRISFMSVFSSVPLFIMFGCAISIVVRKGRLGFHDTFSKTTTVWEKKYVDVEVKEKENINIQPIQIKNNIVEWV